MKTLKLKRNHDRNSRLLAEVIAAQPTTIRLDIGCGPHKKAGFIGCDHTAFPGVDVVCDLNDPWPWADNSVEEAHSSHCIEQAATH